MTEPTRQYIITRWATIVYVNAAGELRHGDFRSAPRNVDLAPDGLLRIAGQPPLAIELVAAGTGIAKGIKHNGLFFCADHDGRFHPARDQLSGWERCLLINPQYDADMLTILQSDWTFQDGQILHSHEITLAYDFILNLGSKRLNLADSDNVLSVERAGAHISTLRFVADAWQVNIARRFHPLIFLAVFGPDHIFEMLRICLESISMFGGYGGKFFVLSDRPAEALAPYIPPELSQRVITGIRAAQDSANMMMNRHDVSDLPIDEFQPVLYIDADMVCNAPLTPALADCNQKDYFYGSSEFHCEPLGNIDVNWRKWFGDFLFEYSGLDTSNVYCLNTGAIAFSNKNFATPVMNIAKASFQKYRVSFPPEKTAGAEQPLLGYALQAQNVIDARKLNKYIRFKTQNFHATEPKTGLVHFNYGIGHNKVTEMSAYFETLKAENEFRLSAQNLTVTLNRSIPGQMTTKELARLALLASQVPPGGIIVEVGCLYGLSSWHIAKHCKPGVTLFCIDPWERQRWITDLVEIPFNAPPFSRQAFEAFTADCDNIVMLQGLSPAIARGWKLAIDLYVEDAVHSNPELAANISFWSDKVKQGGVICGHDYGAQFPDVTAEVNALAIRNSAPVELIDTFWSVSKK